MADMDHTSEINRLHRRQKRGRIVLYAIVGFLAILTVSLVAVSQQIASNNSLDVRSRASESFGRQMQGGDNLEETGFCGVSGEVTYQNKSPFSRCNKDYSGGFFKCQIEDGTIIPVQLPNSGCYTKEEFDAVAANQCALLCQSKSPQPPNNPEPSEEPDPGTPADPSPEPSAEPSPEPDKLVETCVPTTASYYRRGSCSPFEKCDGQTADPLIITCKDANGKTCKQSLAPDQSCPDYKSGTSCQDQYQQRANAFCGL